jgi:hypothetical protein
MEKDVFKFEDFLSGNKIDDLKKMKSDLIKEGLFNEDEDINENDEDIIDQSLNPYNNSSEDFIEDIKPDFEEIYEDSNPIHNDNESYVLYKDKSEEFICDIAIEGVSQKDTEVRLIIESSDWTLMFKGEVKNGKCVIPLKKLSILNEGTIGNIKLEVNADGNLFTPWEDEFIVKVSKKVTVSLNESKKKDSGVKVNVNKKRP